MKFLKTLLLATVVAAFPHCLVYGQKINVDEIVQKHLDSIGTSTDRSQVRNILIKGDVKLSVHRTSPYKAEGKAILASDGTKALFRMAFATPAEWKSPGDLRDNIVFDEQACKLGFPIRQGS